MKVKVIAATLFAVTMNVSRAAPSAPLTMHLHQTPSSSAAGPVRSVWDGVYTEAQKKRGGAIYLRECSGCHGEALKGGEGTPALSGSDFDESWSGKTVADLFNKIRQTMPPPPDQPGKLSPQQESDVLAHILAANDFPAGGAELSPDIEQLKQIRITTARP